MLKLHGNMTQKDRMSVFQEFRAASSGTGSPLYTVYSIWTCLLLGALSPVLHVEGSRTRPGIIVVSRYLFFSRHCAVVAFHQTFSTFAPLRLLSRHCLVHLCSSVLIVHCLSLLFVIAFRHYFLSVPFVVAMCKGLFFKLFMALLNASLFAACFTGLSCCAKLSYSISVNFEIFYISPFCGCILYYFIATPYWERSNVPVPTLIWRTSLFILMAVAQRRGPSRLRSRDLIPGPALRQAGEGAPKTLPRLISLPFLTSDASWRSCWPFINVTNNNNTILYQCPFTCQSHF